MITVPSDITDVQEPFPVKLVLEIQCPALGKLRFGMNRKDEKIAAHVCSQIGVVINGHHSVRKWIGEIGHESQPIVVGRNKRGTLREARLIDDAVSRHGPRSRVKAPAAAKNRVSEQLVGEAEPWLQIAPVWDPYATIAGGSIQIPAQNLA